MSFNLEGGSMEAVKGLQGHWHASDGSWADAGKLRALCGASISPNFRRVNLKLVNCAKCRDKLVEGG